MSVSGFADVGFDPEVARALIADPVAAQAALAEMSEKDQERVAVEMARVDFGAFVRLMWPVVDPGNPLIWGWHLDAMCRHLQAVTTGEIRKLVINIPPGHGKSLIASVLWPAWVWLQDPSHRFITATHSLPLTHRDSVRSRDVITSDIYRRVMGLGQRDRRFWFNESQNVKSYFANSKGGHRVSVSTTSGVTGMRGDTLVIDDAHNADEHLTDQALADVESWFRFRMMSRLDYRRARIVIIMQRLHENDLAGVVLRDGGWCHLCLRAEHDADDIPPATDIGFVDPRTEQGEMLFPEYFGEKQAAEMRTTLGARGYGEQYQQRATSRDGNVFTVDNLRFWYPTELEHCAPKTFVYRGKFIPQSHRPEQKKHTQPPLVVASWDLSFKGGAKNDFVSGLHSEIVGANVYLHDEVHERMGYVDTRASIRDRAGEWGATATLVEDKANGPAIIDELKSEIGGLIPMKPTASKEARALACLPQFEAGNVWLPHPTIAPWVLDFIEEILAFPTGRNDDRVDALTQLLEYARSNNTRAAKAAKARALAGARFV